MSTEDTEYEDLLGYDPSEVHPLPSRNALEDLLGSVNAPIMSEDELIREIAADNELKRASKPRKVKAEPHKKGLNKVAVKDAPAKQAINLIAKSIHSIPAEPPTKGAPVVRSTKELSREKTARLLSSLGVDLGVKLTKNDTAEMLAYIMSANESTLESLVKSKRIPLAIKTVIKSLMDDADRGSLDTLQFLWKRVFGNAPLVEDDSNKVAVGLTQTITQTGDGRPVVVSRQSLVALRKFAESVQQGQINQEEE